MKNTSAGFLISLLLVSCNTSQNNDAIIDDLEVLSDSTGSGEDSLGNSEYAPYGPTKARELSDMRKTSLETILTARGISPSEVPQLALALRDNIGFNEWDVVEEGESTEASIGTDRQPITLTSLIFGPFDGNGRGYSVLAIVGSRIYLSDDYWQYTTTDSAYNIQMAGDKRIEVKEESLSITSPSRGKMVLRNIR